MQVFMMNSSIETIRLPDILNEGCAASIRAKIQSSLDSGHRHILLDLSETRFIDSSGLGELAISFKSVRAVGGRLCFCAVGTQPSMLFELTGMEEVFEIFPTTEACLAALNS